MSRVYECFPGGKYKAVTLSYDDGKIMDRRLISICNSTGLKGTFHLNSEYFDCKEGHCYPYISASEVKTLYKGHEVAGHTCTHPTMNRISSALSVQEVLQDRVNLERLVKVPVKGFSYPNGVFNDNIKIILKACDISYARITGNSEEFSLPEDFLEWKPTCHHNHKLLELTEKFLKQENDQRLMLLYVWGHSYEFERDNNWGLIEKFAETVVGHDSIWYATNKEIYDYMQCISCMQYFADGKGVYNPSYNSVWLSIDKDIYEIKGGETVFFDELKNKSICRDSY
ncbi:polysaccharide deacetylase family protein [Clostridium sp. ZBS15]|uniref:polysaccharide deacetylase family protein n=1 Tax=Clostridium sp. ZBS15 TaxID=2949969 RepID=UPI00207AFB82|nr:polysaccharide deacetylase family protein [Clostridium sp. ZBS15]